MIDNHKALTVGKYIEILKIAELGGEPLERNEEIVSILSGKTVKELDMMPLEDYSVLCKRASFLTAEPRPVPARKTYKCGRFTLCPTLDYKKLTTAQYIDFQTLTRAQEGPVPPYVEILSCLLVPEGCKYCDGYDVADVHAAIRDDLSVEDAASLYHFFMARLVKSMRRSLTSLKGALKAKDRTATEAIREKMREATALLSDGAGWQTWTPFQRLPALLGMTSGE